MARILQVGVGSGGMAVLDMVCRDPRITDVTLIEPDIYKPHNVERHLFPMAAVGQPKAELAREWLLERRSDLQVRTMICDLMAPDAQADLEVEAEVADLGICAVDNEPAKYHWDGLMRRSGKPWTLGEVLSGGIGGFVHWFAPGGPCYGCVASHLKRSVKVDNPPAPDYSQPGGAVHEITIPASIASIHAIAALHALLTLDLLTHGTTWSPGFTTLLLSLQRMPDIFDEAYRPHRFRIPRRDDCLVCRPSQDFAAATPGELDAALDQALARLGEE